MGEEAVMEALQTRVIELAKECHNARTLDLVCKLLQCA